MFRFIHCADVHLGRSIRSHMEMPDEFIQTIQQATYVSFQRIIDKAMDLNVDFVLISGDLFDSEYRSLRAQWFVKKQAVRLAEKNIPLFIIHGNHDPLIGQENELTMPENVHIFKERVESVKIHNGRGDTGYIYGFSYPEKAFMDNPAPLYQRVNDDRAYHIGMLHGQERAQTDHDPYAPFSVKELREKNFDYWALGHIHKRQILSETPPIVYSGNVQGAHRKETGKKGAYYVELTKTGATLSLLETSPVEWMNVQVSINNLELIDQLISGIETTLKVEEGSKQYLVDLSIIGEGILHDQLVNYRDQQELLSLLREELSHIPYLWIERMEVNTTAVFDRESLREQDHLLGDVVRVVDEMKKQESDGEALEPLYSHPAMNRFLEKLTHKEREEIIDHAEKLLLSSLMKGDGKS
ncbi:metallophosphoesterase family protein [Evansella tamaricis]|uniref:DNA repair exonuclease n=1 Tax=Evansella tamaricis TaxID=2069301 RepID=A0ABS6JGE2_9BACI|nr:DNA repair exonuclease [Evansella tamaricis]MBU9712661.1 DNA repair exonuclease [Evansella tamaricis]